MNDIIVNSQLIENCLSALNQIRNTKVKPQLTTYDLAKQLDEAINQNKSKIFVSWAIEDILSIRPDLTDEQAIRVLEHADHKHDACIGISWDVLQIHAEHLFPEKE